MRILIVGGTQFVGRAIAEAALGNGHDVTLLHRGKNEADFSAGSAVEHIHMDRNADLSALDGHIFDATIDVCAYVPRQVDSLAEALDGHGGHHVLISTMSVFADPNGPGLTEDGQLTRLSNQESEEVTGETYGGLKAQCEKAAATAYDKDALTILRPTYVIGPHDYSGRFTWWVRRIARGGVVLAPGPHDSPFQLVDARDLAAFTVKLVEEYKAGAFNAVTPTPPFGFGDLLDATVRAVGPADTRLEWVDPEWLSEQGDNYQSMPLWTQGDREWILAADPTKAATAGLNPRSLTHTISDTWDWIRHEQPPMVTGWGISDEREQELLKAWEARA